MANEITLGFRSGATLTYGAYQPNGTVRTAAGTSLPEVSSTGYYTADDGDVEPGDIVIVKEGTDVVAWGEYNPDVTSGTIEADLTTIEDKVDTAIAAASSVTNVYNEVPVQQPTLTVY